MNARTIVVGFNGITQIPREIRLIVSLIIGSIVRSQAARSELDNRVEADAQRRRRKREEMGRGSGERWLHEIPVELDRVGQDLAGDTTHFNWNRNYEKLINYILGRYNTFQLKSKLRKIDKLYFRVKLGLTTRTKFTKSFWTQCAFLPCTSQVFLRTCVFCEKNNEICMSKILVLISHI